MSTPPPSSARSAAERPSSVERLRPPQWRPYCRVSANLARHVLANSAFACLLVAQNPLDGRSGITTAPVMVHIQGYSGGTPALALKMRPRARPLLSITS
jgi:hypothetical protein